MPPRTALFQRPPGGAPDGAIPPEIAAALSGGPGGPPPEASEGPEPASCPNCGCVFDPASGEVIQPPGQADGAPAPSGGPPMTMGA